jgi:hypothetical protein
VSVNDVIRAVEDDRCRSCFDVVATRNLFPEITEHIEPDDLGLALQVFLDPIHDGFGREAPHSGVAEELHDYGLPAANHAVERRVRRESSGSGAQQEPNADHGYNSD